MYRKLMWPTLAVVSLMTAVVGCVPGGLTDIFGNQQPTGVAAEVAAKAESVAANIGGADGFGGAMMNGFSGHMDDHMGFHGTEYLAQDGGMMTMELANQTGQPCTFHIAFISSPDGVREQSQDVTVDAGDTVNFEMPCAEMVGMGSLTNVGQMAAHMGDGAEIDNRFCVPGFLNSDFDCGGAFSCTLMQDTNDLDQDGDTQEFVAVTSAMQTHIGQNGMNSHGNGAGTSTVGMMGGLFSGSGMFGGMRSTP